MPGGSDGRLRSREAIPSLLGVEMGLRHGELRGVTAYCEAAKRTPNYELEDRVRILTQKVIAGCEAAERSPHSFLGDECMRREHGPSFD